MKNCNVHQLSNKPSIKLWCVKHHSAVVATNGVICLRSTIAPSAKPEILKLNAHNYPKGIAIWGVTPPVYDTTEQATPNGLHVHLFEDDSNHAEITCNTLYIKSQDWDDYLQMDAFAATTYMTSIVFEQIPVTLMCLNCREAHLDKGQKAVIPSRIHTCNTCNTKFETNEKCIGNPIMHIKQLLGDFATNRPTIPASRDLNLSQKDFPGGIRIWGSNGAIIWTVPRLQKEGIHIHCFDRDSETPLIDTTVDTLTIDGISLDAKMVRYFMAQQLLPQLQSSLSSLVCPQCSQPHFDQDQYALIPHLNHVCEYCGNLFVSSRRVVSNPLIIMLSVLYQRL
jgi:hypothetical protein